MQPTTNQPQMQAPTASTKPVLPADQAAAHLGFVTNMHEQLLQHKAGGVKPPVEPQGGQGQQEEPKDKEGEESSKLDDLEAKMEQKMEILRTEMKDTMKTEIGSIKDMLSKAPEDEQA